MSDQHVVTDWRAYFDGLVPGTPSPFSQDFQPMYNGPVRLSVTFMQGEGLEEAVCLEGVPFLDWCLDVWAVEGRPEMWVFTHQGGPPWHVPAQPTATPRKGRRA